MRIKTCLNWHQPEFASKGEINNEPSMTIPDDSLSIKEILDRYARGLPLGGERVPVYNGEEWLPDFERMSTIERSEWLQENADYIRELREQVKEVPQTENVASPPQSPPQSDSDVKPN